MLMNAQMISLEEPVSSLEMTAKLFSLPGE